jgi:(1->4)-alpha-D-glucan 1-alpha-D-glucosylmutase
MRVPTATYRLQLSSALTFADAAALVPYLAELGVSDLYASPIFTARPGSVHGYDVIDHGELNPELGGEAGLELLVEALRAHGLGLLLDLVPNHMCIAGDLNRRWLDVLENGPGAASARFFDIDWRPPKAELVGKVLLPVLPKQYGEALERDLSVAFADGRFQLAYDDTRLPMDPRTWAHVLEPVLEQLRRQHGDEEPDVLELESIMRALSHLPFRTDVSPARVRERTHEKEVIRRRLLALVERSADVRRVVDEGLDELNRHPAPPATTERLEALVAAQGYRLSHWRVAADEINYRRFFDVNDLAAIRVEDPAVFATVHALPLALAARKVVTGFRIDHVDGLSDPEHYLAELRRAWSAAALAAGGAAEADEAGYVVVEKILMSHERMPDGWATAGTTGYDFLNLVAGVLISAAGGQRLKVIADRFTGEPQRLADVMYEGKKLVLRAALSAELTVLARRLDRISEQHRYTRDFTLNSLHEVLAEIIACFPIYRTYVRPSEGVVGERDRATIETAIRLAKRRNPVISESLFDFVRSLLLLEAPPGLAEAQIEERRDFVRRFQQLTGPVTAKGVEDTAFYRYFPLAALSEVGGDPSRIGVSPEEFHRHNGERLRLTPHALSATATHDTKRGEDLRARLFTLSELPEEWERALERFRDLNRRWKTDMGGWEGPDAGDELLLYQTLIGTWPVGGVRAPAYPDRISAYMQKAIHEAKRHTSWVSPNTAYIDAVARFVRAALDPRANGDFLGELDAFVVRIARAGYANALAQVVLKIGSPGVPDFYQGCEQWDFSLVDPDNRRPVDFAARRAALAALASGPSQRPTSTTLASLAATPEDGRIKLLVTRRGLALRRARRALFERGRYEPLTAQGTQGEHVIAFARVHGKEAALIVATRLPCGLTPDGRWPTGDLWADSRLLLPAALGTRRYRDVLSNTAIEFRAGDATPVLPLARIFAELPVAILEAVD